MFGNADYIHTYTRSDAIKDGVLIDVTETARKMGYKIPVAVTSTVWEKAITVNKKVELCGDSVSGRLWDVLWMLLCAIKKNGNTRELKYHLYVTKEDCSHELVTLKALSGPGDNLEPVITIMMPDED